MTSVWAVTGLIAVVGVIGCAYILMTAGRSARVTPFFMGLFMAATVALAIRADEAEGELNTRRLTALVTDNVRLRVVFDVPPSPVEAP